jgi:hypothetical protein
MNDQPPTRPEDAPGHYGAGYGEQVPENAPPRPAPQTDSDAAQSDPGDAPVVFTPEDVHARPPDHPPTEDAPESEKAGLIFERS